MGIKLQPLGPSFLETSDFANISVRLVLPFVQSAELLNAEQRVAIVPTLMYTFLFCTILGTSDWPPCKLGDKPSGFIKYSEFID